MTDAEPASFVKAGVCTVEGPEWDEFTFSLPAWARHFAIRHVSAQPFLLQIDDVTYTAGSGSIDHFNLYRDGEKVYEGTDLEFVDVPDAGNHEYAVTITYVSGEESAPLRASVYTSSVFDSVS